MCLRQIGGRRSHVRSVEGCWRQHLQPAVVNTLHTVSPLLLCQIAAQITLSRLAAGASKGAQAGGHVIYGTITPGGAGC